MPPSAAVCLCDAHLGHESGRVRDALHRFLAQLPAVAPHAIVCGDLFEFWFAYRRVIPRAAFATLHALQTVRERGVRLTIVGGNHDRWGGDFWERELGAEYHPHEARLEVAGLRCVVRHGDGLADPAPASRLLQRIVHHRWTARAFRWIHPDIGLALVERLAGGFPGKRDSTEFFARAAKAQAAFARNYLRQQRSIDVLIMGHTHRPALERVESAGWYLNPGAWMDGYRYAELGPDGPTLRQWSEADA